MMKKRKSREKLLNAAVILIVALNLSFSPAILMSVEANHSINSGYKASTPEKVSKFLAKKQQRSQKEMEKFWKENIVPGEVIVKFKTNNQQPTTKQLTTLNNIAAGLAQKTNAKILGKVNKLGVALLKTSANTMAATQKLIQQLQKDPNVEYAEPNFKVKKMGEIVPWGVEKVKAPNAWTNNNVKGNGVIVAVVDTGVDYNHPDLDDNIWINADEISGNGVDDDGNGFIDDRYGWDFYANYGLQPNTDNDPLDENGHGTHVAGIIAAEDNDEYVVGVAPKATIMAVKVLDSEGHGTSKSVADGIIYAADNGADIINLSLGGYGYSRMLERAVNYAVNKGVLVVAAAGNDYWDIPLYPASYENVISVGATDSDNKIAWFSNFGKVDLAAPGYNIESLQLDGKTVVYSGTSMATPHVAGVAALIKEKNPGYNFNQIRQVLESTATDLGEVGKDIYFGAGLVNAEAASDGSYEGSVTIKIADAGYIFTDGQDSKEIKATIYDSSMNPVVGENVTFTATNGTIDSTPIATNDSGQASKTLTSTTAKNISKVTVSTQNYGSQTIQIMLKRTDVVLNNVWISTEDDEDGYSKLTTTFQPGQKVFFMFDIFNNYYKSQDVIIEYEVKNEKDETIEDLSGSFSKTIKGDTCWLYSGYGLTYACGQYWASTSWLTIPDDLPNGIYTVTGKITVGSQTSSFSSKFTVGEPSLVLVLGGAEYYRWDRPFGWHFESTATYGGYYLSALDELNKTYTYWDCDLESGGSCYYDPDYNEYEISREYGPNFRDWGVTIIFDPAYVKAVLNGELNDYLIAGGKILVTSENALSEPYEEAERGKVKPPEEEEEEEANINPFGVVYSETRYDPETVSGIAGEILEGLSLDINWRHWEGDGAINQQAVQEFTIPNESFNITLSCEDEYDEDEYDEEENGEECEPVTVTATATPILQYDDEALAGAKIDTEKLYQAVFLSFGFEGINEANDRKEVMGKILDWFLPAPQITKVKMYREGIDEEKTKLYDTEDNLITIAGQNFSPIGVTKVQPYIGENFFDAFTDMDVVDRQTINIKLPAGTLKKGTYSLKVTNPDGQTATIKDALIIDHRSGPSISSVSPSWGYDIKSYKITILGKGFYKDEIEGNPTVKINGANLSNVKVVSSTKLTATIPKGLTPRKYDVKVINADGQSATKSKAFRVYKSPYLFKKDLKFGMVDDDVLKLQERLEKEGFFPSWVKKVKHFGLVTYWSVVKYQRANGLPITGRCDATTRAKLNEWYTKNVLLDWLK